MTIELWQVSKRKRRHNIIQEKVNKTKQLIVTLAEKRLPFSTRHGTWWRNFEKFRPALRLAVFGSWFGQTSSYFLFYLTLVLRITHKLRRWRARVYSLSNTYSSLGHAWESRAKIGKNTPLTGTGPTNYSDTDTEPTVDTRSDGLNLVRCLLPLPSLRPSCRARVSDDQWVSAVGQHTTSTTICGTYWMEILCEIGCWLLVESSGIHF